MSGPRQAIAVFGSSEPVEGDALYERARSLGEELARAGFAVVTGGYGGVMEAASRGAVEAGGSAVGVTCDIFSARRGNRWLGREIRTPDLFDRTRELVELARGYVIVAGKAGTLAELAFLWALHRAGCLEGRPVLVWSDPWGPTIEHLRRHGLLDDAQLDVTHVVESPAAAVAVLERELASGREG